MSYVGKLEDKVIELREENTEMINLIISLLDCGELDVYELLKLYKSSSFKSWYNVFSEAKNLGDSVDFSSITYTLLENIGEGIKEELKKAVELYENIENEEEIKNKIDNIEVNPYVCGFTSNLDNCIWEYYQMTAEEISKYYKLERILEDINNDLEEY